MSGLGHFNETERTAVIAISTAGDNTIIAAPGVGKRIYIDHINWLVGAATTLTLKNGSTPVSGAYAFTTGGGNAIDNAPVLEHGIIECSDNAAFIINLGSAVSVQGFVRYRINNE